MSTSNTFCLWNNIERVKVQTKTSKYLALLKKNYPNKKGIICINLINFRHFFFWKPWVFPFLCFRTSKNGPKRVPAKKGCKKGLSTVFWLIILVHWICPQIWLSALRILRIRRKYSRPERPLQARVLKF